MTRKKTGRSRADKEARRTARLAKKQARSDARAVDPFGSASPGWHTMDELDSMPDEAFVNPFDTIDPDREKSACPVGDHCTGCGTTTGLGVMLSAFGSSEIACTTVCRRCDGTSMLHLREVGPAGIDARVTAHREHRSQLASSAN